MDIIQAINSDRIFKPLFRDLRTWKSWLVFLKAVSGFGIEDSSERRLLRKCTGLRTPPTQQAREAYCIVGRRGGKSWISSIISVYLACFRDWKPFLSPGEKPWVFVIAVDRAQAAVVKNYISGILHSSPLFERTIKKELKDEIHLDSGINIAIKTSDFRSVRGFTVAACICEELAFWRDENSANPAQEILTALRPAMSTIPKSLLLGISTPYSRAGTLWEQFRSHYGKSGGVLVWKADALTMNPTLDKGIIKDALRNDPAAARAEWMAEFREDTEAFLPPSLVDDAIVPSRLELPTVRDATYCGFVDPSAGRQDSFTLGIAHMSQNTGKVILDLVREAKPPFRPEEIVQEFSDMLKQYRIFHIEADRYAGEWVVDSFRRNNIHVENSTRSKSEIYMTFLQLISNQSVELLDNKRLRSQLCALERRTRSGGRDHVDNFFGHDDVANAASGACVMAARCEVRLPPPSFGIVERAGEESMDSKAVRWLLGQKKQKSQEKSEEEELAEIDREIEKEMEAERKSEATIKRGWR